MKIQGRRGNPFRIRIFLEIVKYYFGKGLKQPCMSPVLMFKETIRTVTDRVPSKTRKKRDGLLTQRLRAACCRQHGQLDMFSTGFTKLKAIAVKDIGLHKI